MLQTLTAMKHERDVENVIASNAIHCRKVGYITHSHGSARVF